MKNRYFTGTLILIVLLASGILIKSESQIQQIPQKFKVGVRVSFNEVVVRSLVEGYIKKELRGLGDIEIVGADIRDGLWDYIIALDLVGLEIIPNEPVTAYAVCIQYYWRVPFDRFKPIYQNEFEGLPTVYYPHVQVGAYGIDQLENLGKIAVASFDTMYLQPYRDERLRQSR